MRRPLNRRDLAPGLALTAGSAAVLVAAALPDPRVFSTSDPIERLHAIAARPWGWNAQAVLFPIAFAAVASGFWLTAVREFRPRQRGRRLAETASLLSAAAVVLWLPISWSRLRTASELPAALSQPRETAADLFKAPTFWPYTGAALLAVVALAAALAWGGVRRRTGAAAAVLAGGGLAAIPFLRDWPPFATYLFVLAMGIALLIRPRPAAT